MKKYVALCVAVCLLMVALAGCQAQSGASPSPKENITVVFVPKLTGNAFFDSANDGAQAYAARNGFAVEYQGSSTASVDKQIEIIEAAIEQKVDAICVSALDAQALDAVMKKAMTAGIQVTTWDSDVSGDARTVMVSQGTPDQLGAMLVDMGAAALTNRGKDPVKDTINYVWHYSQATVTDQNSWQAAGEAYIQTTYPNWVNVNPTNYYSEQDPDKAVAVGAEILDTYPDIDLIICNDSTSLPGQAEAAQQKGLTAQEVTITGFASPNAMREYCKAGVVERWGLWDCQIQGSLGCYLAYYLASGHTIKVGDKIAVPEIGTVEVMANTVLDSGAYTANNSGVVLLPDRSVYTIDNVDNYNF